MLEVKRSLNVKYGSGAGAQTRTLQLCYGPINDLAEKDKVEFMCVSALPNNYTPTRSSQIGKLFHKGLNVAELAKNKEKDYRTNSYCWLSKEVPKNLPGIKFNKLIVLESDRVKVNLLDIVDNIFKVVNEYKESKQTSIAIPMIGGSVRRIPEADMLTALFHAAVTWQARAFPLNTVKLVAENAATIDNLVMVFDRLAANYNNVMDLNFTYGYSGYASNAKNKIQYLKSQDKMPACLTDRQVFGIYIYTTNYYRTINSTLRANDKKSDIYRNLMPLFEAIDTGLANIKNYTGMAYRKSNLTSESLKDYDVGKDVIHLAYTSSSSAKDVWSGNSLFNIKSLTGSSIAFCSQYPGENEILFGRLMINHVTSRNIDVSPMVFNIDEKIKQI